MSVLPCLAVLLYLIRRRSPRSDRNHLVMRVFIGGIAVTVLAYVAQRSLSFLTSDWSVDSLGRVALESIIGAALVEEALKLVIVLRFAYRRPEMREISDAIVMAVSAGLGFCCLENILYAGANVTIGLGRAFTALPLHALASGLMGYEIGLSKLRPRSRQRVWHGLWKAVLVHGLYNFILMGVTAGALPHLAAFLVVPLLGTAYMWLLSELKVAGQKDRAQAYLDAHQTEAPSMFDQPPSAAGSMVHDMHPAQRSNRQSSP